MMGNIILWAILIWMPGLLYIMLVNETKFKKNIVVGVTLPFEGRKHPDVIAQLDQFKKQELWVCIGLMALGVPGMLFESSISFNLWLWWVLLMVLLPFVPYVLCNRNLKRIKAENGWKRDSSEQVTVDLSAIPVFHWLSPWVFVPAVVLSLLPLLWERDLASMYMIDAVIVMLCWLGYRYLFRQKAETVDDNAQLILALTRIRQCYWGRMWLLCAYAIAAINVGISVTKYSTVGIIVVMTLLMVVLVGASMAMELRLRRLQETLTADSGKGYYVDDDDKWIGGIVYYNPNDSRLLINDRVGINTGLNLAKPAGKVIYVLLALVLLTIPLWGVAMDGGELTMEVTEEQLMISDQYVIHRDAIQEVTLLPELPEGLVRVYGVGAPEYLAGKFSCKDYGPVQLCLDPTAPPFLLIETETGFYLGGTRDPELTQSVYETLK